MIKVALVEDELIIANNIKNLLEKAGYHVTGIYTSYDEVLALLETEKPDLILLDIRLSGRKTGIDLARVIENNYQIPYIFITSHSNKKIIDQVKKLRPCGYLVKPFKPEDLYTSIELGLNEYNQRRQTRSEKTVADSFFLKQNGYFHRIYTKDILFVKSDHMYLEIFLSDGEKFLYRSSFSAFLDQVPHTDFLKVHRSYIVKLDAISAINSVNLMIDNHKVPIGKKYRRVLMDTFDLS